MFACFLLNQVLLQIRKLQINDYIIIIIIRTKKINYIRKKHLQKKGKKIFISKVDTFCLFVCAYHFPNPNGRLSIPLFLFDLILLFNDDNKFSSSCFNSELDAAAVTVVPVAIASDRSLMSFLSRT